jgi:C4-dicarboxylate-specific signal transduction histidine kinase
VTLKGSTYVTESGRVLHMFIASDKSDFYKMMARMREVQDQLTHSARLASLGEMAAGIGHELTQPLNAILLLARNCLKAMQNPEANQQDDRRKPQHHHRPGEQGLQHHQQPEEFRQQGPDTMVPVNINVILIDILNFFESQFTLSDIGLDLKLDTQRTIEVMGQEVKFEQVFFNLIQNAILSMGKTPEPRLTISTGIGDSINPTSLKEEPYVRIDVCDNGEGSPGNPGKDLRPLFHHPGDRLGHGSRPVHRRPDCPRFRGLYQGRQHAGEGTCFTVYLPAHHGSDG